MQEEGMRRGKRVYTAGMHLQVEIENGTEQTQSTYTLYVCIYIHRRPVSTQKPGRGYSGELVWCPEFQLILPTCISI